VRNSSARARAGIACARKSALNKFGKPIRRLLLLCSDRAIGAKLAIYIPTPLQSAPDVLEAWINLNNYKILDA
jgi:hypothetical protein